MAVSYERAKYAKSCFLASRRQETAQKYMQSLGISKIVTQDTEAPTEQHEDFCLLLGLTDHLPSGVTVPERYHGVRIFTRVVDQAVALKTNANEESRATKYKEATSRLYRFGDALMEDPAWKKLNPAFALTRVRNNVPDVNSEEGKQYCFEVRISQALPPNLVAPTEFEGIRVFVKQTPSVVAC